MLTCRIDETIEVNHQLAGYLEGVNRLESPKDYHVVRSSSHRPSALSAQVTEATRRDRFV